MRYKLKYPIIKSIKLVRLNLEENLTYNKCYL